MSFSPRLEKLPKPMTCQSNATSPMPIATLVMLLLLMSKTQNPPLSVLRNSKSAVSVPKKPPTPANWKLAADKANW
jgi:hypothetical protein